MVNFQCILLHYSKKKPMQISYICTLVVIVDDALCGFFFLETLLVACANHLATTVEIS